MGTISNILDALRRLGSETERSALQRQDAQLAERKVLGRRRSRIRDEAGESDSFVATITPIDEVVTPLSEDALQGIHESALKASRFLGAFHPQCPEPWRAADLDIAFSAWIFAQDAKGYSSGEVIDIVGASFGDFCVDQLGMRWVSIADVSGVALAVQGVECDVRAFPFHAIAKRIPLREHGFLVSIFVTLKDAMASGDYRSTP